MAVSVLTWLLRLGGVLLCSATFAVFLPRDVMIATNAALGLDPLPEVPLTFYLARSTSILYALHGLVLLLASTDLVRYRPLVSVIGASNLVFGSVMLGIDVSSGMPWWWTAGEGPFVIATGVALVVLVRRVPVSALERQRREGKASAPPAASAGARLPFDSAQSTPSHVQLMAPRPTSGETRAGAPAPSPSRETS